LQPFPESGISDQPSPIRARVCGCLRCPYSAALLCAGSWFRVRHDGAFFGTISRSFEAEARRLLLAVRRWPRIRAAGVSFQNDDEDLESVKSAVVSAEYAVKVLTIGHSTRSLDDLIAALRKNGVKRLIDIRTIPRSRHNPQFNREELAASLPSAGIAYEHRPGLGGLRHPRKDSPNGGWRNAGFRGFADYMQTPAFAAEAGALIGEAQRERVAIMCAEAVPWRCHRSLVADALSVRGVEIEHIMSADHRIPHKLTRFARVDGMQLTYPPAEPTLF
jgi:Domain of unknown function DUF488